MEQAFLMILTHPSEVSEVLGCALMRMPRWPLERVFPPKSKVAACAAMQLARLR